MSQLTTEGGKELQIVDAAQLKDRLPKSVCLKGNIVKWNGQWSQRLNATACRHVPTECIVTTVHSLIRQQIFMFLERGRKTQTLL